MLRGNLLHPEILAALARAGHGSQVLIADGNYPFSTGSNPGACLVFLNLSPGLLKVTDVLKVLVGAIPIEAATVMGKEGDEPPIFQEFREILPPELKLNSLERFAFYNAARKETVALVVATGEKRVYANILLTIGVIPPNP